jgi:pyroglutamyl-peptidase
MKGPVGQSVLVTGFEPFDGETLNPSMAVAQALHGMRLDGHRVHAAVLPCVFGDALQALDEAMSRVRPALVLALGQAGRAEISVERVAINVDDARIADNAGARPIDRAVVDGGPAAYFSSLPIKAMVETMRRAGLPAAVSQTAGTFVCNHVFYGLMHRLMACPGVRGGFVHLPLLPDQALHRGGFSLPLPVMIGGVRIALLTALRQQGDLPLSGGAEA